MDLIKTPNGARICGDVFDAFGLEERTKKMSDFIKREDAIKVTAKAVGHILYDADAVMRHVMNSVPSADVVEGIKCSECEFLRIYNTKDLYARCTKWDINFFPFETDTRTHGCSWGERKDNE